MLNYVADEIVLYKLSSFNNNREIPRDSKFHCKKTFGEFLQRPLFKDTQIFTGR